MLLAVTQKCLQVISCITTVFIAQKHFLKFAVVFYRKSLVKLWKSGIDKVIYCTSCLETDLSSCYSSEHFTSSYSLANKMKIPVVVQCELRNVWLGLRKGKGLGRRVKSKIPCKGKLGHAPKSSCTIQSTALPTCSIRTRSLSKRSRSILSLSSFCLSISSLSLSLCRHSSRSCIIRIRSRSRRSRSAISLRLKKKKEGAEIHLKNSVIQN